MKALWGFLLLIATFVFLYLGRDEQDEVRSWNKRKKAAVQIACISAALACLFGGSYLLVSFLFL